jgi:hypothetical protein
MIDTADFWRFNHPEEQEVGTTGHNRLTYVSLLAGIHLRKKQRYRKPTLKKWIF